MSNKNYRNGARKERKIANDLKAEGWDIAQRSAGSHSPVDVWAVNKKLKKIKCIQAKPDSMGKKARERIEEEMSWLNNTFRVEFYVE